MEGGKGGGGDRETPIHDAAPVEARNPQNHDTIPDREQSVTEKALVDRIDRSDRWMIGLTAAIAFSGLLSAGIFGWQLSIMKGQLTEMRAARESGDTSSANQLTQMRDQTTAMQGQLKEIQSDRRPWMAPGDITIVKPLRFDESGASVVFDMPIINGGKAVAEKVNINVSLFIRPLPERTLLSGRGMTATSVVSEAIRKAMGPACDPPSVKGLSDITGVLVLPGAVRPEKRLNLTAKMQDFQLNPGPVKNVSAWVNFCVGYVDDRGLPHGTSFILVYANTEDADQFSPTGTVDGIFHIHGFTMSAY